VPYAVDGSNLGGVVGGRGGARDREATAILPWSRSRGRVVLVFDGSPDPRIARAYGPLEVIFAASRSADAKILELIHESPRDWWVVTDDRALATACRDHGARHLTVGELIGRLGGRESSTAPGKPTGPVDVEAWEEYFRLHRDD
jgi:hypothetical protein